MPYRFSFLLLRCIRCKFNTIRAENHGAPDPARNRHSKKCLANALNDQPPVRFKCAQGGDWLFLFRFNDVRNDTMLYEAHSQRLWNWANNGQSASSSSQRFMSTFSMTAPSAPDRLTSARRSFVAAGPGFAAWAVLFAVLGFACYAYHKDDAIMVEKMRRGSDIGA